CHAVSAAHSAASATLFPYTTLFRSYSYTQEQYHVFVDLMKNDKKNEDNKIGFALLKDIGNCTYNIYVEEDDIKSALDYYSKVSQDRKSTRLNSSHVKISYAVFCLKK